MARLGELEHKVMDVGWESMGNPLTGRHIARRVARPGVHHGAHHLDRLRRKCVVQRSTHGRTHRVDANGAAP